ncbi:MAG: UDP-N-acetylglucosamine 1-carboxyvinyltransferase [Deltaproteobacteria bacterium]
MQKLVIKGGNQLEGEINISGAKNSAVAIIPATLLVDGPCRIENIPDIKDVKIFLKILENLGANITYIDAQTVIIDTTKVDCYEACYDEASKIRASYYLIGALLGRFKKAKVSFPGGCDFGTRPLDQHIKAFEALGAKVDMTHGIINANAETLRGSSFYMDIVSVGATINAMLTAVKAVGTTIIENAAKEPHIVDVANFLNNMGASIIGAGTDIIKIKGVETLPGGGTYSIVPDQIEAGTFMIASAITCGDITIRNCIPKHLESLTAKLVEIGVNIEENEDGDSLRIRADKSLLPVNIKTQPYPGFPTDLQPQFCALAAKINGVSIITEAVWDSRFQYISELRRMGADIKIEGRIAIVSGKNKLFGAKVKAIDLRAGAAMILAGLGAEGITEIFELGIIDRGYEKVEEKFIQLGADMKRMPISEEDL